MAPLEIVRDFLSRWEEPGGFAGAVRDHFTTETVWENIGLTKTTGPHEACAVFAGFGAEPGRDLAMRVDLLAIAAQGNKVLTERIDQILGSDGNPDRCFPVAGIFEVQGGKIVAWRDYFATAGMASQSQR